MSRAPGLVTISSRQAAAMAAPRIRKFLQPFLEVSVRNDHSLPAKAARPVASLVSSALGDNVASTLSDDVAMRAGDYG